MLLDARRFLVVWTLVSVTAAQIQSGPPSHDVNGEYKLTLLHTNDVHARFEPSDKYGGPCPEKNEDSCFGGVARRVTKVREIRNNTDNVLLVDGGDQYQGTLWFVYYRGLATSHFMKKVGYDAMALGNHEFDNGVQGLAPFLQNATWDVLSANMDASKDKYINGLFNKSAVITVGGRKIGVIGYTTKETPELVIPSGIRDLTFTDEIPAIQAEVDKLEAIGVNIIIAVGHSGFTVDKQVAAQVRGIDVVVGGHSNTFLYTGTPPSREVPAGPYPTEEVGVSGRKVPVVQDFAFGKYLGKLDLVFNSKGELLRSGGNPILLNSSVLEDPEVKAELATWRKPLDEQAKKKVGETWVYLEGNRMVCRLRECNLGNAMTDAMILAAPRNETSGVWADTSIAIWNSGGIRNSIKQGNISLESVLSTFPFQNTMSKVTMLGKHLKATLENSVAKYNPENAPGAFLQMSGLRVVYSLCKPSGSRVREVLVKCTNCIIPTFQPLQADKVYSLLLSDFLIEGGDNYDSIAQHSIHIYPLEILDSTVFSDYARLRSPITLGVEGRITFREDCNTSGASSTSRLQSFPILCSLLFMLYSFIN